MRKKMYEVNLNCFITKAMLDELSAKWQSLGYPSQSSYIRKLLRVGLQKDIQYEE